jgi:hypothetical protein
VLQGKASYICLEAFPTSNWRCSLIAQLRLSLFS